MDEERRKRITCRRCGGLRSQHYNLHIQVIIIIIIIIIDIHLYRYLLFLIATVLQMDLAAPGPHDPSVLHMQDDHRSSVLWEV